MVTNAETKDLARKRRAQMAKAQKDHDLLEQYEQSLLRSSAMVAADAMDFSSIPFDAEFPPQAWIDELGEVNAWSKFRRVKAGQMPSSEAPIGVKAALSITTSLIRSRAIQSGKTVLNVGTVQLTVAPEGTYTYPTITVEAKET